jgi:hypothetical protein
MKNLLFVIFLIYTTNLFSQHTDSAKVIVYDPFNANQTVDVKKDLVHEKNIIKWNIGLLGRGAFEMDYERCITDKFTGEVGVGLTYLDFIREAFTNLNGATTDFSFQNTTIKYGPLFTADIKFYPKSALGFEGLYISIPVRFRSYASARKITYEIPNPGGNYIETTSTFQDNSNYFEYGFIVGNQTNIYHGDVTWDYFFGVGLNAMSTNGPVLDVNHIPQQTRDQHTRPIFFLGIKMGFPFN